VPQNVVAGLTESFRVGPPILATGRIVDPLAADRIVAEGRADAVGMTRALIADPDLPRKLREGRLADVLRCIACNACIAHYHAGTPIGCTQNPRTGRERTLPRPAGDRPGRRVVVVGGGPAGLAAGAEARAAGAEVVLFERSQRIGGQIALAGAAPANAETAAALVANYEHLLAGADVRVGVEADAVAVAGLHPDAVVVATGGRPFEPDVPLAGVEALQGWDVLAGSRPRDRAVVVADWGGDSTGLDCAELLAAEGFEVTLASAALVPGEALHQYRRNLAIGRLYRAGIRVEHHVELAGAATGTVVVRNLLAPELATEIRADAVVLALGRVPDDTLVVPLRARGLRVEVAGDCLSPRSLEEAILEGTLAARRTLDL
jgi:NADPH-dependent 2,4-dienoyl-CoA reductase/sulfur reductase-like enzyme